MYKNSCLAYCLTWNVVYKSNEKYTRTTQTCMCTFLSLSNLIKFASNLNFRSTVYLHVIFIKGVIFTNTHEYVEVLLFKRRPAFNPGIVRRLNLNTNFTCLTIWSGYCQIKSYNYFSFEVLSNWLYNEFCFIYSQLYYNSNV